MPNDLQIDIWRQTYSTTDSGPTYRLGRNLVVLTGSADDETPAALTHFENGFVADCEVSWDGTRIVFARRAENDPWWHIWTVNADGSALTQVTRGPYHDVQPVFLPDGRIIFSSSRIGMRDEYHGYPATGLTVMAADGSDIHCIGFNLGRDNEPALRADGTIVFSRLELFYSRLKTELTVQAAAPDGTRNVTLYGPERRAFWRSVTGHSKERWWGEVPPRHRVLRLTQPQELPDGTILCASTGGPVVAGPGRHRETLLRQNRDMAVTGMFPLGDGTALCAATRRTFTRNEVDLGLYRLDLASGDLTLLYNDPAHAEFEPRPLAARTPPPTLAEVPRTNEFTGTLVCASAFTTQDRPVRERGRLLRVVEGQPVMSRHHTHTSSSGHAWKNHVGTHARVLATVPLAADGSFAVTVPADRLLHCQILDSNRRVVGNQLIWMYVRPGETKSCVGCHEPPDTTPPRHAAGMPAAATQLPVPCLPTGSPFSYRAKAWQKGILATETEERTRTVRAVNVMGRY